MIKKKIALLKARIDGFSELFKSITRLTISVRSFFMTFAGLGVLIIVTLGNSGDYLSSMFNADQRNNGSEYADDFYEISGIEYEKAMRIINREYGELSDMKCHKSNGEVLCHIKIKKTEDQKSKKGEFDIFMDKFKEIHLNIEKDKIYEKLDEMQLQQNNKMLQRIEDSLKSDKTFNDHVVIKLNQDMKGAIKMEEMSSEIKKF